MSYETFPALSTNASREFPGASLNWPVVETEFESGWEEVRATQSQGRYSFTVIYRVNELDADEILQFIEDRKLKVEPFWYDHPLIGTSLVRYNSNELPTKTLVHGAVVWYEIELPMREAFG